MMKVDNDLKSFISSMGEYLLNVKNFIIEDIVKELSESKSAFHNSLYRKVTLRVFPVVVKTILVYIIQMYYHKVFI